MIRVETQIGKLKLQIEVDSAKDLFETLDEIGKRYAETGIDKSLLLNSSQEMPQTIQKQIIPQQMFVDPSIREPEEILNLLKKLVSLNEQGIIPRFPKGSFKARELILLYIYANYLQNKKTPLRELSEFLTSEHITRGAKDVMMSTLRKERVIVQNEGIIEALNIQQIRENIKNMAAKIAEEE